MADIDKLVRENVRRLLPYSCARDEFKGNSGVFLDANENPYGILNRYPDPYQTELKKAISIYKGVPSENIFLGNGSDEVIDLCFRVFCNPGKDKVLTFPPTYGMYEVSASVNDVEVLKVPLNESFQLDMNKILPVLSDPRLKLVFICSPNNPTGNCLNSDDIEEIIKSFNGIVVIDEAYIDFSNKPSFNKLLGKYSNLIIMQTFSKAFALAAVRVGMAFADNEIIKYFNKIKPPYNISSINQKTALEKLSKAELFRKQIEIIKLEKEKLASGLRDFLMVEEIFPSDANFLLVRVKDANYIYNELIKMNIVVRNRNSIVNNCIRITVGTPGENIKLLKALKKIKI